MYITVYDIRDTFFPTEIKLLALSVIILLFTLGPLLVLYFRKESLTSAHLLKRLNFNEQIIASAIKFRSLLYYSGVVVFGLGGVIAILFSAVLFYLIIDENYRLLRAMSSGNVYVVEGQVGDFKEFEPTGADVDEGAERFTINGISFSYTPKLDGAGYHRSAREGGFIKPGARVRLTYVIDGNNLKIVKVEVPQ